MRLARRVRLDRLSLFGVARTVLLLGVGLGLSAGALIAYGMDALGSLELRTVDARFAVRGTRPPPPEIAMVAIDAETTRRMGQLPLPRAKYAPVLDRLRADGARVIAIDLQFIGPSDPRNDTALYEAVKRAGNVVLPTTELSIKSDRSLGASAPRIRPVTTILGGERNLREAHARASSTLFSRDPDGRVRRIPSQLYGLDSFAIVSAERATGRQITAASFDTKALLGSGPRNPLLGPSYWIDFCGPGGTIPSTPFWRVARGRFPRGFFREKVVVIGPTAPGAGYEFPTAVDRRMPGLELSANAIATALHGFPITDSPRWLDVALVLLLGLIPALAAIWLRARWALLAAVVALGLYIVAVQLAFNEGLVLPLLYPLAALAATCVGVVPARYVTESFEHARRLFQRFVPESFARTVIADREHVRRGGGETLDATVMFADLRAFTTYAESLPPDEVIEVVNRYLQEMSDCILDHGGTVVTYLGDGIMAVFGAPQAQPDHAERALAAAIEMLDSRLASFNEWLAKKEHGATFGIGIGLNSGPVISGTVGSERRLEYAAIGDTTNTAARLQAMCKETGTPLVVAKSTRERLNGGEQALERIGELTLRGREGTIEAWTLRHGATGSRAEAAIRDHAPG